MADEYVTLELDPATTDFRLLTDDTGRHYAQLTVSRDGIKRALHNVTHNGLTNVQQFVDRRGLPGYNRETATEPKQKEIR